VIVNPPVVDAAGIIFSPADAKALILVLLSIAMEKPATFFPVNPTCQSGASKPQTPNVITLSCARIMTIDCNGLVCSFEDGAWISLPQMLSRPAFAFGDGTFSDKTFSKLTRPSKQFHQVTHTYSAAGNISSRSASLFHRRRPGQSKAVDHIQLYAGAVISCVLHVCSLLHWNVPAPIHFHSL